MEFAKRIANSRVFGLFPALASRRPNVQRVYARSNPVAKSDRHLSEIAEGSFVADLLCTQTGDFGKVKALREHKCLIRVTKPDSQDIGKFRVT
jgi:hypothetical protein